MYGMPNQRGSADAYKSVGFYAVALHATTSWDSYNYVSNSNSINNSSHCP